MENGFDLWLLNRGNNFRTPPKGAKLIRADIRKIAEVTSAISRLVFDVVVDWIAYDVGHVKNDVELFKDKTVQYIFYQFSFGLPKAP